MANPDVWPAAVEESYEDSLRGEWVMGFVSWNDNANFYNSSGWMQHFEDQATATRGLSGPMNLPPSAEPRAYTRMNLEVKKVGSANTTVTVSMPAGGLRVLDDPYGGRWWGSPTTSFMFQVWPDDGVSIWVWLQHPPKGEARNPGVYKG